MEASRAEMFRKLLERDPENPMILYSLGNELFRQKKYSEAREYLSRAVRNKPDYSVAHRTLGRTLYELREDTEAHRAFAEGREVARKDRKSTRLNSSHANISYAVFCLKKKKTYTV